MKKIFCLMTASFFLICASRTASASPLRPPALRCLKAAPSSHPFTLSKKADGDFTLTLWNEGINTGLWASFYNLTTGDFYTFDWPEDHTSTMDIEPGTYDILINNSNGGPDRSITLSCENNNGIQATATGHNSVTISNIQLDEDHSTIVDVE